MSKIEQIKNSLQQILAINGEPVFHGFYVTNVALARRYAKHACYLPISAHDRYDGYNGDLSYLDDPQMKKFDRPYRVNVYEPKYLNFLGAENFNHIDVGPSDAPPLIVEMGHPFENFYGECIYVTHYTPEGHFGHEVRFFYAENNCNEAILCLLDFVESDILSPRATEVWANFFTREPDCLSNCFNYFSSHRYYPPSGIENY